jgi:hypothetical protein
MGRKNDAWSSQKVLGLRRTGIQVWAQHVATWGRPLASGTIHRLRT